MNLESHFRAARRALTGPARALARSAGERATWRRQLVDRPKPSAENAMGMARDGSYFETEDVQIDIDHQGRDSQDRHRVICHVEPLAGDLIICRAGRLRCLHTDARRDPDGRLIYALVTCVDERSGR